MSQSIKTPCLRCGALIHGDYPISLKTVMQLSKIEPTELVEKIIQLEGVDRDLAQDFVNHQMGYNCIKNEPPCPKCGSPLKTWHAASCLKCDWKRDPNKQLPEYYK